MTLEVLKALAVILEFCKNCPMAQFCQKMPCEWQSNSFRQNAAAPVWSRIFAQARSIEIKNQNG